MKKSLMADEEGGEEEAASAHKAKKSRRTY